MLRNNYKNNSKVSCKKPGDMNKELKQFSNSNMIQ